MDNNIYLHIYDYEWHGREERLRSRFGCTPHWLIGHGQWGAKDKLSPREIQNKYHRDSVPVLPFLACPSQSYFDSAFKKHTKLIYVSMQIECRMWMWHGQADQPLHNYNCCIVGSFGYFSGHYIEEGYMVKRRGEGGGWLFNGLSTVTSASK